MGNATLSSRECECLELLARGEKQSEIAQKLDLQLRTVEQHLGSARRKLNARTTVQAVVVAITLGQINP